MPYRSPYRRRPSSDLAADPEFLKGRAAGLLGIPGDIINLVGRDLPRAAQRVAREKNTYSGVIGGPLANYGRGPVIDPNYTQPADIEQNALPPFSERTGTSENIAKLLGADPNSLKTQAGILAGLNPASLLKAAPLLATKLSILTKGNPKSRQVTTEQAIARFTKNNPETKEYDEFIKNNGIYLQNKMQKSMDQISTISDPKKQHKFAKDQIYEIEQDIVNKYKATKLSKGSGLLDDATRLKRAKDMGFNVDQVVYHGSTHDVKAFDPSKGNVEGHFGDAIYFTDSPSDASKNYARQGPDLTGRIERKAEELADKIENQFQEKGRQKVIDSLYRSFGDLGIVSSKVANMDDTDAAYNIGKILAKNKLHGGQDNIMPAYVKMNNPIDLTKKNQGWDLITEFDEAGNYVDESGNALELYEAVMDTARKYNFDGQKLFNDLELYDYKSYKEVDDALRKSDVLFDVSTETGEIASHQVIKEIYEAAGFDGVIMDASKTFKNMDIPDGTKHYIIFKPNQARSKHAEFDPDKIDSSDLMSNLLGPSKPPMRSLLA